MFRKEEEGHMPSEALVCLSDPILSGHIVKNGRRSGRPVLVLDGPHEEVVARYRAAAAEGEPFPVVFLGRRVFGMDWMAFHGILQALAPLPNLVLVEPDEWRPTEQEWAYMSACGTRVRTARPSGVPVPVSALFEPMRIPDGMCCWTGHD